MRRTRFAVIVFGTVLIAPLPSLAQASLPWPDKWQAQGQSCHAVPLPAGVSKLEQVLDSAPVFAALGDAAHAKGWAVLSISFDSTGKVQDVTVPASDLGDDVKAKIAAAAKSAAKPQSTVGSAQVRVQLQDGAHFTLAPSESCEAHSAGNDVIIRLADNQANVETMRTSTASRAGSQTAQRAAPRAANMISTVVELTIAPDGHAVESRVKQSSGNKDADVAAQRVAMRATFLPALLDRVPVVGVATITYRQPEPER
ncbi:MAG: energy transducer TonB [Gemmatimonadota bacterium]|nr:energy transducer TonB [Gemmatimonadota bacterium]